MDTRWLDPAGCPDSSPPEAALHPSTRALHDAIDARTRQTGVPYLHPSEPTVQLDLFGSPAMASWQDRKAMLLWTEEACWSALPQVYARYGTGSTAALLARVQALERAEGVVLTDCGMQAVGLVADALMTAGSHAVVLEQVYNKSRTLFEWTAGRVGGAVTVVPDGDLEAVAAAIRPETRVLFAETYTNPRLRAQDIKGLVALVAKARELAPELRLVLDTTVASPWGLAEPALETGVDLVVASGTKSLCGEDTDLWGYVAGRDVTVLNSVMDVQALRGGALDWRRAQALLPKLAQAEQRARQRSASATKVATFLASHPKVGEVLHPSRPEHPDADVIAGQYALSGGLLSFRVEGADEEATRRFCDVLCMSRWLRYALSFDGLTTKVNHHSTVSEYFTPAPVRRRRGLDRLVRIGVGLEDPDDLIAALNWALWHGDAQNVEAWRAERRADLGLDTSDGRPVTSVPAGD